MMSFKQDWDIRDTVSKVIVLTVTTMTKMVMMMMIVVIDISPDGC